MKNVFLVLLIFALSNSIFAQTNIDQQKEVENLMAANRAWAKAASPEAFMSFIDKDALMMAPDKGIAKGHESIGELLGEFQSYPGFEIKWEPQEAFVSKSGDIGYTIDKILVNFNGENGTSYGYSLKSGSHWGDRRWKEWDEVVETKYEYNITRDAKITVATTEYDCLQVIGIGKNELGQTKFTGYFNSFEGFVKMIYVNIDSSKIVITMKK